jgi:hypothetical protein
LTKKITITGPKNLRATAIRNTQLCLTWDCDTVNNTNKFKNYQIYVNGTPYKSVTDYGDMACFVDSLGASKENMFSVRTTYTDNTMSEFATISYAIEPNAAYRVLSDNNVSNSQNNWGGYWYYYDDNADKGNSRITNAFRFYPDSLMRYMMMFTSGEGNPNESSIKGVAKCSYTFGSQNASFGSNLIGMGLDFIKNGGIANPIPLNLTGADSITYWAYSSVPIVASILLQTKEVTDYGYHQVNHSFSSGWKKYTIVFNQLTQPGWADKKPLSLNNVTQLAFQINEDAGNPQSATFWIDDLKIYGFNN